MLSSKACRDVRAVGLQSQDIRGGKTYDAVVLVVFSYAEMTYLRRRLCAPPAASNDHIAATLAKSRNKRLAINSRPRGMGVMLEWGQRRNCSGRGSGASFGRSAAALLSLRILPDGINRADDQDRRHGVDAPALLVRLGHAVGVIPRLRLLAGKLQHRLLAGCCARASSGHATRATEQRDELAPSCMTGKEHCEG